MISAKSLSSTRRVMPNAVYRYKFGSKYMFGNKDYYLRRTKFIVYQLAMIFCVVSESLGEECSGEIQRSIAADHPIRHRGP